MLLVCDIQGKYEAGHKYGWAVSLRSSLNGCHRTPEEAAVLDVPGCNVAVIESNIQLGIQLRCFGQADV